jgi:hypothetical protein
VGRRPGASLLLLLPGCCGRACIMQLPNGAAASAQSCAPQPCRQLPPAQAAVQDALAESRLWPLAPGPWLPLLPSQVKHLVLVCPAGIPTKPDGWESRFMEDKWAWRCWAAGLMG